MQRFTPRNRALRFPAELSFLWLALFAAGCSGSAAGPAAESRPKPLAGTSLVMSCPDDRLRKLFEPMARIWAHETGAVVTVSAAPMGDQTDLAILPMAELGRRAEHGELVPVPSNIREPGHEYQWSTVLDAFRGEACAGWGNQLFGLPVAAETALIVYRADRFADPAMQADFQKRHGRALAAPTTWESFADTAAFFAERDKRPSLPPQDAARLDDLFMRVAACYDRPALAGDAAGSNSLGFAFDLASGRPRLETSGFLEAARWLAGLKQRGCLPADGNPEPAESLEGGRAVLAIATLNDLMQLNPDHRRAGRYGLAALPGTKSFANPSTGRLAPVAMNRVPYLSGGRVGVVRKGGKSPDAAFSLLAELSGPVRSREIVAAGGFAPVRESQLEPDRLLVWLGYGFDEKTTRQLQDILRTNLGASVRNPVYGLRSPDEVELRTALQTELIAIANGSATPEAGLKRVNEKWGSALRPEWRRRAAGVN